MIDVAITRSGTARRTKSAEADVRGAYAEEEETEGADMANLPSRQGPCGPDTGTLPEARRPAM